METLDLQFNVEHIIKDLLLESQENISKEIEQYKQKVSNHCSKIMDQSKSQLDLKLSLIKYESDIKEIAAKESQQELCYQELKQEKLLLESEIEGGRRKKEDLLELLNKKTSDKNEICQANDAKLQEIENRSKNLAGHISWYKEYLGLEIRPLKNNRIQFVFNNLQPNSADIAFVIIQLNSRVYTILDTEPELSNIKELEQELNQTNNLAGFIQAVRKCLLQEI